MDETMMKRLRGLRRDGVDSATTMRQAADALEAKDREIAAALGLQQGTALVVKQLEAEVAALRRHEGELERSLSEVHRSLREAHSDNATLRELLREAIEYVELDSETPDCIGRWKAALAKTTSAAGSTPTNQDNPGDNP